MNVYGELTLAQLENKTSDPTLAAASTGRIWMRTDLGQVKIDLGGSADILAGLAATQAFTNKTFSDAITFSQISTPSNPAANKDKFYFKSDDNLYTLNSAGTETLIAPPSTISYAAKTHANTGATLSNGFTLWTLTNTNNDTATIPAASSNAGKVFIIKLAAMTAALNTLTLGRSGSDTFTLADGTTGATSLVLQTAGETYELVSDGTSVWQVKDHRCNTAWSTAWTFTPNGFGTLAASTFIARRIGDSLECILYFRAGTVAASTASVTIPIALNAANLVTDDSYFGNGAVTAGVSENISSNGNVLFVFYDSSDATKVFIGIETAADASNKTFTTKNGSGLGASGCSISLKFTVPISGWVA